jgi:DNA-binding FadR family transcriptional regulator
MIVEGDLDAGCKVPCARFGVSRTPLREVLNRLSVKGWALPENHRAGRGVSISCDGITHSSGERTGLNRSVRFKQRLWQPSEVTP